AERSWRVGVIKRVTFGQFNVDAIVFGPGIVEIDRILSISSCEEWCFSVLKECRLEEESFARALRVIRNADVETVNERLGVLHDIFDFDVRDLSRAHLSLH